MPLCDEMKSLFDRALHGWTEVSARYKALSDAKRRIVDVDGCSIAGVLNPSRAVSTVAKVDAETIKARPCFLCPANQPPEQEALLWQNYKIQVNPFPIFSRLHFTISSRRHEPQLLTGHFDAMIELARLLPDFVVFYNGAGAGASAPDHFHFQAGPKDELPLCHTPHWLAGERYHLNSESVPSELAGVMNEAELQCPINLLCWVDERGLVTLHLFRRKRHRPACYGSGEGQLLISPGSIDLAGLVTTIRPTDFTALSPTILRDIFSAVTR